MDVALLVARLVLAAVFAVAGVSKLADLKGSQDAIKGFGLPEALAPSLGLLLPLAELTIAVTLLFGATAWAASLAAAALLLAFVAGISINLARGRKPDCHCFGQLHSEPIGPNILIRNGVLLALAAFVAVEGYSSPGTSATNWIDTLSAVEVTGLVIVVVLAAMAAAQWYFLFNVIRQNGRLILRLETLETQGPSGGEPRELPAQAPTPVFGLPVGSTAPGFSLSGLFGETMTLGAFQAQGNPVLLLFTSPSCVPCTALMPDIAVWQRERSDRFTTVMLSAGDIDSVRAKMREHGITNVLLDPNNGIAMTYAFAGTPGAVVVGTDGTIASPVAAGIDAIRDLVAERFGTAPVQQPAVPQSVPAPIPAPPPAPSPFLGEPAPAFDLPDLSGRQIRLTDFQGKDALLVFWNTGCGFCRSMVSDLKDWEETKPEGSPEIVVFSAGPIEEVREMGLASTVIHDPNFTVSNAYGASGTPMAILVNGEGKLASGVAAGAEAVLQLAGREASPGQAAAPPMVPASRVGDVAPAIHLKDVDGTAVDLADFLGRETLVLFWNTGCGFCQQMLPNLRAWIQTRAAGSPEILVVSSGPPDEIRAMNLGVPIGVDEGFGLGPAFGANGTPIGVLVDPTGKIASAPAEGADAVLALLRTRTSAPFSA